MGGVVRFFGAPVTLLLLAVLLPSYFVTSTCKAEDSRITLDPGDWARYTGSFPNDEYEWMMISVVAVDDGVVNASLSYDLRYPYKLTWNGQIPQQYQRYITIHVAGGYDNLFLWLIPAGLDVGDSVPVPSTYPQLTINGTTSQEFCGSNRTVVYTTYTEMPWGGQSAEYWDKETGLLLGVYAKVGNPSFPSLRLIDTNIWSNSLLNQISANSVFITLAAASVILQVCMLLALIRTRRINTRVTRPNAGKALMGIGAALFVVALANLTSFNQTVFSISAVLSLVFIVDGVLIYGGTWAGDNLGMDVGVILFSLSLILFANAAVCVMYREVGALVPQMRDADTYGISRRATATLDAIMLFPYAWLASPLAAIGFALVVAGIFKSFYHS
jgi:small basic protein